MSTRLQVAYRTQVAAVRRGTAEFTRQQWLSLPSYHDVDATAFKKAVVPRVEASQRAIAQLANAYIAHAAVPITDKPAKLGPVKNASTLALRGVSADTVYQRPFTSLYTAIAAGGSLEAGIAAGSLRLASLVDTGMQLAETHASQDSLERSGVQTWQRVLNNPHPCGLCVIASTQRYWRGDLMPIHPGCDCGVEPSDGKPNTQVIHPERLKQLQAAVDRQFGADDTGARWLDGANSYSDYLDLVTTQDHGEIGPVLTWSHQHFTSLADIA